ncbi:Hypothetical predicted protein [Mytilus galloprovincialis]|uniref:SRCR domain-containing protein n=1 Tax=Mytilus galloprovincialis TaxID=29158 RepID=A0A8B6EPV0_MYTGA|nr:Hypothetical predicted protein [Mytilus galloprovincialis]
MAGLSTSGKVQVFPNAYFGRGTGPVLLSGLTCAGHEDNIDSCGSDGWYKTGSYCGHQYDVGVSCPVLDNEGEPDISWRTVSTDVNQQSKDIEAIVGDRETEKIYGHRAELQGANQLMESQVKGKITREKCYSCGSHTHYRSSSPYVNSSKSATQTWSQ